MNLIVSPNDPICDRINPYNLPNSTSLIKGFEGIPQNITINLVAFIIVFLLFCILRKKAWNYGRLALYFRKEDEINARSDYNVWNYGSTDKTKSDLSSELDEENAEDETSKLKRKFTIDDKSSSFDQGYFNWIRFFWEISDKEIENKAGQDASDYLLFVKYLIFVTFFLMVLCLGFILPLHIYGDRKNQTRAEFVSTTIMNLPSDSNLIWVHAIISVVLFLFIICVIWHYAYRVKLISFKETSNILLIEGVPKEHCFKNNLVEHFKEAYPDVNVIDIHIAHNVKKLIQLQLEVEIAKRALEDGQQQFEATNIRPKMVPYSGGRICKLCLKSIDLIDYYESEVESLNLEVERETYLAFENKIGIVFVICQTVGDALSIFEDYRTFCLMPNYPRTSKLTVSLKSREWNVSFAPEPSLIKWENLCTSSKKWYLKAIFINILVFIILLLMSTPTYVFNIVQIYILGFIPKNNTVYRLIQSFLMWLVSLLLPFIVYYSEILIGHWTRTQEHRATIIKTTIFLIVMVLIFPSLGIASLPRFINWIFPQGSTNVALMNQTRSVNVTVRHDKFLLQWLCVYAPGNCAFFVNYLITTAFLGSIMELMRVPELILYLYHLIVVRSSVEMWGIRKRIIYEFQFGLSYSWILCVFAITITYCVICPLVVPFGFIYMVLRYFIDRYNLYYAYTRSRISGKIHRLVLSITVFSFLLLQVNVLVYLKVKGTEDNLIYIFMLISFLMSFILFIVLASNGWFVASKLKEMEKVMPDPVVEESKESIGDKIDKWGLLFNTFNFQNLQNPSSNKNKQITTTR